ncbi:MAG: rod-binding protein [Vampirovibrionales bacterium]
MMNSINTQANTINQLQLQAQTTFDAPQTQKTKELKHVAQEFEAVFIQQLMTAMDKTVDREDSLISGGEAEESFRGMLNQEMAKNMAHAPGSGRGLGMAESIYKQAVLLLSPEELTPPPAGQQPSNHTLNPVLKKTIASFGG